MNMIFDGRNLLELRTFEGLGYVILIRFIRGLLMNRLLLCFGLFLLEPDYTGSALENPISYSNSADKSPLSSSQQ